MDMTERDDPTKAQDFPELDAFFAAGRAAAPEPSADLMARILADAETALPRAATPAPRRNRSAGLLSLLGGWRGFSGLATATLAGLWIGIAMPETVQALAAAALDTTYATEPATIDLMAQPFDIAASEG